jgi:hypothetical protein
MSPRQTGAVMTLRSTRRAFDRLVLPSGGAPELFINRYEFGQLRRCCINSLDTSSDFLDTQIEALHSAMPNVLVLAHRG